MPIQDAIEPLESIAEQADEADKPITTTQNGMSYCLFFDDDNNSNYLCYVRKLQSNILKIYYSSKWSTQNHSWRKQS